MGGWFEKAPYEGYGIGSVGLSGNRKKEPRTSTISVTNAASENIKVTVGVVVGTVLRTVANVHLVPGASHAFRLPYGEYHVKAKGTIANRVVRLRRSGESITVTGVL